MVMLFDTSFIVACVAVAVFAGIVMGRFTAHDMKKHPEDYDFKENH